MRQVFNALPYILPADGAEIVEIYKRYGTLRKIKRGWILKNGGDGNKLYMLQKGLCIYMINYNLEKPRGLSLLLPGRAMGDITCISGEIVNVTTVAMRNSEVLVIPPEILKQKMMEHFPVAIKVTNQIISKQECHLEGMIANFTLPHEERLITFYKALIISLGGLTGDKWQKIPLRLSNEELGTLIHATRVTVNRIHLKWTENGLFKKEGKELFISGELLENLYDWRDYVNNN